MAERNGGIVAVGQRGHGIGPRLIDALIAHMDTDKDIVWRSRAVTRP